MALGVNGAVNFTPSPEERRLEIGIIGAGIAGLGAAIGLGQAGHDVEVGNLTTSGGLEETTGVDGRILYNADLRPLAQIFEHSRFANEVGAAIHCCPNGTRVLQQFGFDFERANADLFGCGTVMRRDTTESTYFSTYDLWESKYGVRGHFFHRVDLHTELKELAQTKSRPSCCEDQNVG